MTERNNT